MKALAVLALLLAAPLSDAAIRDATMWCFTVLGFLTWCGPRHAVPGGTIAMFEKNDIHVLRLVALGLVVGCGVGVGLFVVLAR
jgi:hypothetical protein